MAKKLPPLVLIVVNGGCADVVEVIEGTGVPSVYILDWDNIEGGDDLPEFDPEDWERLSEETRKEITDSMDQEKKMRSSEPQ